MSSLAQPTLPATEPGAGLGPQIAPSRSQDAAQASTAARPSWVHEHWRSGVTGGLVMVEVLIGLIWLIDLVHFELTDLGVGDAWGLVFEKSRFEKLTALAEGLFVFAIFFLLLPATVAAVLAGLRKLADKNAQHKKDKEKDEEKEKEAKGPIAVTPVSIDPSIRSILSRRIQRKLFRGGRKTLALHSFLSVVIAVGTVLMESMQRLAGNRYTSAGLVWSFFSVWLAVVSTVKWITPAFLLPVARKYLVRMFGGEHPHFLEVVHEIFTEEGFRAG